MGDTGKVPLERYATAGCAWQIVQVPPGIANVSVVPRAGAGRAPGAATLETLRLRATAPGQHEVVLALRRPWEATALWEIWVNVRAR